MRNIARHSRGQIVVECALVLPLIILMGIGMLEYAHLWYNAHVLTSAARHGARICCMAGDETASRTAVVNFLDDDSASGSEFTYGFTAADCTITFGAFDASAAASELTGSGGAVVDAEHGDYIMCSVQRDVPLLFRGMMPGTTGMTEMTITRRAFFMRN